MKELNFERAVQASMIRLHEKQVALSTYPRPGGNLRSMGLTMSIFTARSGATSYMRGVARFPQSGFVTQDATCVALGANDGRPHSRKRPVWVKSRNVNIARPIRGDVWAERRRGEPRLVQLDGLANAVGCDRQDPTGAQFRLGSFRPNVRLKCSAAGKPKNKQKQQKQNKVWDLLKVRSK